MTTGGRTSARLVVPVGAVPLGLAVLLACVIGGYIVNDATALAPGLDSLFQSVFGGSDSPLMTHAIIALPILGTIAYGLLSRRIQQVPGQVFAAIWLLFFFFLGVSNAFSSFRALSFSIWLEWLVYGCVLFATVACIGRTRGPSLVLWSLVFGCLIVAIKGILEYGGERGTDPSSRVYAGWVNPNASAALLLLGFFVALGLCLGRSRLESLLAGLATVMIAFTIFLTGSKGAASLGLPLGTVAIGVAMTRARLPAGAAILAAAGIEALVIGIGFLKNVPWVGLVSSLGFAAGCLLIFADKERRVIAVSRLLACFGALMAVLVLLTITSASGAAPSASSGKIVAPIATPIQRVTSGNRTEEQSATFRLNLWKSALQLIKEKPITGWGMATYRFESGRPGLTTSTVFAHNVYLQIFAEGGVAAFCLFVSGIAVWFWMVARSHSRLADPAVAPLAGAIAAVVALLSHCLVDSDLYYFGIGVAFFALLGVGLLLSADSVAPEFVPKPARILCSLGTLGLFLSLIVASVADDQRARFRYDVKASPDPTTLQADADALSWLTGFDGDAAYLAAQVKTDHERSEALQEAFRLSPTERIGRALARQCLEDRNWSAAIVTLKQALERDPNNLLTLTALINAQLAFDDVKSAIETAKRLVAVEDSPYFKVRSIPESVPTETYTARFDVLAKYEPDPKKKADLLAAGVRGMMAYIETSHYIYGNSDHGKEADLSFPGFDSWNEARAKLVSAAQAARQAAKLYREMGDATAAAEMEADGPAFEEALGPASSPK